MKKRIEGFTLIEILVVSTIIALLAAAATLSYSQLSKQARDARRKTDLEQIRAAIEMYRSNNDVYPALTINCSSSGGITDAQNTYLSTIPNDPKCSTYSYYYTNTDFGYTLGAHLETNSTTCKSLTTQCTNNCTYCVGPYGEEY